MHFDYENPAKTRDEAAEKWPNSTFYERVEGGWAAFDTEAEIEQWENQK